MIADATNHLFTNGPGKQDKNLKPNKAEMGKIKTQVPANKQADIATSVRHKTPGRFQKTLNYSQKNRRERNRVRYTDKHRT